MIFSDGLTEEGRPVCWKEGIPLLGSVMNPLFLSPFFFLLIKPLILTFLSPATDRRKTFHWGNTGTTDGQGCLLLQNHQLSLNLLP